MRDGNAREYMLFLSDSKLSFELEVSNYTMKAVAGELSKTFVAHMQSKRTFAAFAKIKSDVTKKPLPSLDASSLKYFQHDFNKNGKYKTVFNIDISSAYATILYNEDYITEETFKYLKGLKKQERLASLGMLASRKKHFSFVKGNPIEVNERVSETSNFFFYAVKRTYEVMNNLKQICGTDYLFTWVDGIYFLPNDEALISCCEYLDFLNLGYKVEILTDFEVSLKDEYVSVSFFKDKDFKVFRLPSRDTEFRSLIMEATILYNSKMKHEKTKISPAR